MEHGAGATHGILLPNMAIAPLVPSPKSTLYALLSPDMTGIVNPTASGAGPEAGVAVRDPLTVSVAVREVLPLPVLVLVKEMVEV